MVAGLALDKGIVASCVVEGLFTRETFLEYLHDSVASIVPFHFFYLIYHSHQHSYQMPLTTPDLGPCSIILIDNAHIHHGEDIEDLIHGFGMWGLKDTSPSANNVW